jgi:hypothetical protein
MNTLLSDCQLLIKDSAPQSYLLRGVDNIKMDLKEILYEVVVWI